MQKEIEIKIQLKNRENIAKKLKELGGKKEKLMRGLLYSTPEILNRINFFFKGKKIAIENLPPYKFKNYGHSIFSKFFEKQKNSRAFN